MKKKLGILLFLIIISTYFSNAQQSYNSPSSFDFNRQGLVFLSNDSLMLAIFRFRIQNGFSINTLSEDNLDIANSDLSVRRLRFRIGGYLYDKRLTYNFQLSFSRGDMDFNDTQFPNIIRDAMVFWNFTPDFQISFGQTKLPGNRQRVISSADLQFMDRSIVNSRFTLDRDFGLQSGYKFGIGDSKFNLRAALSSGDGRNQVPISSDGFAYTGRLEFLPFGEFTQGGDYIEGDHYFEETPKLSLGISGSHNDRTTRTGGQLGGRLFSQKSFTTLYCDGIMKYNGISVYAEYANRTSASPITKDPTDTNRLAYIYTGSGYLLQASYLTKSNFELALRYALVQPDDKVNFISNADEERNISGNIGYYFRKHRAKALLEVTHRTLTNLTGIERKNWLIRFSTELGI